MRIIDEIMPKIRAEARLDKDNKTIWIKTDTLDGYDRIIIEDGSVWCRIFYEDCGECAHNKSEQTENSSEKPNNCEDLQDWKDRMWTEAIVTEPTTEDCSMVDKDINVCSKEEPQTERIKTPDYCDICNHKGCGNCIANNLDDYCVPSGYEPITQMKTQNSNLTFEKADERCKGCGHYKLTCDLFSEICKYEPKDEPQTERNEK